VKPIPEGYHTLTPGLVVRNGAEAIEWYKRGLGATEVMRMMSPDGKRLMHGELKIGDSVLMLGEEMPGMPVAWPKGKEQPPMGLYMYVADVDAAYEKAVGAGAKGVQPPKDMFWGDRYARIVDPYGHHWGIATHKEDVPPDELKRRGEAWAKKQAEKMKKKKAPAEK
jgi:PhnB protein